MLCFSNRKSFAHASPLVTAGMEQQQRQRACCSGRYRQLKLCGQCGHVPVHLCCTPMLHHSSSCPWIIYELSVHYPWITLILCCCCCCAELRVPPQPVHQHSQRVHRRRLGQGRAAWRQRAQPGEGVRHRFVWGKCGRDTRRSKISDPGLVGIYQSVHWLSQERAYVTGVHGESVQGTTNAQDIARPLDLGEHQWAES